MMSVPGMARDHLNQDGIIGSVRKEIEEKNRKHNEEMERMRVQEVERRAREAEDTLDRIRTDPNYIDPYKPARKRPAPTR